MASFIRFCLLLLLQHRCSAQPAFTPPAAGEWAEAPGAPSSGISQYWAPPAGSGFSVVYGDNTAMVWGGSYGTSLIYLYQFNGYQWVAYQPAVPFFSAQIEGHCTVAHPSGLGFITFGGGSNQSTGAAFPSSQNFWYWSQATNNFTQLPSSGGNQLWDSACTVAKGRYVYIHGGYLYGSSNYEDNFMAFDLQTNVWLGYGFAGSPRLRKHKMTSDGGNNVYIWGGLPYPGLPTNQVLYHLDFAVGSLGWQPVNPSPSPNGRLFNFFSYVPFCSSLVAGAGLSASGSQASDFWIMRSDNLTSGWAPLPGPTNSSMSLGLNSFSGEGLGHLPDDLLVLIGSEGSSVHVYIFNAANYNYATSPPSTSTSTQVPTGTDVGSFMSSSFSGTGVETESTSTSYLPFSGSGGMSTSFLPYKTDTSFLPYEFDTSFLPYESSTSFLPYKTDTSFLPFETDTSFLPYESATVSSETSRTPTLGTFYSSAPALPLSKSTSAAEARTSSDVATPLARISGTWTLTISPLGGVFNQSAMEFINNVQVVQDTAATIAHQLAIPELWVKVYLSLGRRRLQTAAASVFNVIASWDVEIPADSGFTASEIQEVVDFAAPAATGTDTVTPNVQSVLNAAFAAVGVSAQVHPLPAPSVTYKVASNTTAAASISEAATVTSIGGTGPPPKPADTTNSDLTTLASIRGTFTFTIDAGSNMTAAQLAQDSQVGLVMAIISILKDLFDVPFQWISVQLNYRRRLSMRRLQSTMGVSWVVYIPSANSNLTAADIATLASKMTPPPGNDTLTPLLEAELNMVLTPIGVSVTLSPIAAPSVWYGRAFHPQGTSQTNMLPIIAGIAGGGGVAILGLTICLCRVCRRPSGGTVQLQLKEDGGSEPVKWHLEKGHNFLEGAMMTMHPTEAAHWNAATDPRALRVVWDVDVGHPEQYGFTFPQPHADPSGAARRAEEAEPGNMLPLRPVDAPTGILSPKHHHDVKVKMGKGSGPVVDVFKTGECVEYYSSSHNLWTHGVIERRDGHTEDTITYSVSAGNTQQHRPLVCCDQLRPLLEKDEPIKFLMRSTWVAGRVLSSCPVGVLHRSYSVKEEGTGEVHHAVGSEKIRHRYDKGVSVVVYQGPVAGWQRGQVVEELSEIAAPVRESITSQEQIPVWPMVLISIRSRDHTTVEHIVPAYFLRLKDPAGVELAAWVTIPKHSAIDGKIGFGPCLKTSTSLH